MALQQRERLGVGRARDQHAATENGHGGQSEARASVAARPKPSEWSVSPEETLDGQPAAAQPAADNPNAKGEVLGLDK